MTVARETAAQLDSAIDVLLEGRRGPAPAPEGELTATARLLRDVLPRFHPGFGFEELLAARLTALGRATSRSTTEPTPLHSGAEAAATGSIDMAEAAERRRRGLVASGAIASGVSLAIPLAGAALVVWRRSRSSGGLL